MSKSLWTVNFEKPAFIYRFDIYIPIVDNEGYLIDGKKFKQVRKEVLQKFGGVTFNYPHGGGGIDGIYIGSGNTYHDKNAIFTVFSNQDEGCTDFFVDRKAKWQKLFEQKALLITLQAMQTL